MKISFKEVPKPMQKWYYKNCSIIIVIALCLGKDVFLVKHYTEFYAQLYSGLLTACGMLCAIPAFVKGSSNNFNPSGAKWSLWIGAACGFAGGPVAAVLCGMAFYHFMADKKESE